MMKKKKTVSILFIGNSHTYYNDMPALVKRRAEDEGFECRITMIAHGGWSLEQHAKEPEVRFNILYGNYDYVVLQEHSHPFSPEEKFSDAAHELNALIREAGSIPIIFETWAKKDEPKMQEYMNRVHQRIAMEIDALVAPIGENWQSYMRSWPDLEVYDPDGMHASYSGSTFAAKYIWTTIDDDIRRKENEEKYRKYTRY